MAKPLGFVLEGWDQVSHQLRLTPKVIGVGYERGLEKALDYLYKKSQIEVPVDTTALKKSGYWIVIGDGINATGEVGYGGPSQPDPDNPVHIDVNYALIVHEMKDNQHEPPTKAKYLEDPAKNNHHYMMEIVRREMDREMRLKLRGGIPFRGPWPQS